MIIYKTGITLKDLVFLLKESQMALSLKKAKLWVRHQTRRHTHKCGVFLIAVVLATIAVCATPT